MPSLYEYKAHLANNGNTNGMAYKNNSDMIMEATWNRDLSAKKCYIYDYYHDDQPWRNEGMTYENTTKTPIDAKFIINQSQSIEKDRVEVMLQFRPSEKLRFEQGDDLYYYETEYKARYNMSYPCGMYCDLPDDKGVYHKWLICAKQIGNQFIKYLILPCNYRFSWIETNGDQRIIRRVWGATRSQNSYNSGLWSDFYTTQTENQFKAMLPMNLITEKIFYTNDTNQNQRLIISAMLNNPIVWQVSKCETMLMGEFGLMRLTFKQVAFNDSTDCIDRNATNPDGTKDVYAMYANYLDSTVTPVEPSDPIVQGNTCVLSSSTSTIKSGGSYKTITANFYDGDGTDIAENYLSELSVANWQFFIDETEVTDSDLITVLAQTQTNKVKVKFAKNDDYLTKVLVVRCTVQGVVGELSLEITNL